MKKTPRIWIVLAIVVVVIVFGAVGWLLRDGSVVMAPDEEELTGAQTGGIRNLPTSKSLESNELIYDFKDLTMEEDVLVLRGCVEMPDERFWMPMIVLKNETTGEVYSNGSFSNEKDPTNNDPEYRCHEFRFYDVVVNKGDVIQVSIENLEAYLDPTIADGKDLAMIRERISEKFPGLTFELIVEKGNGGGGGRFEIRENPEGISEDDFFAAFNEATILHYPLGIEFSISY
jgi:hypothetical protein